MLNYFFFLYFSNKSQNTVPFLKQLQINHIQNKAGREMKHVKLYLMLHKHAFL